MPAIVSHSLGDLVWGIKNYDWLVLQRQSQDFRQHCIKATPVDDRRELVKKNKLFHLPFIRLYKSMLIKTLI